jgi:plasmid maintenance system antidote protein VapI
MSAHMKMRPIKAYEYIDVKVGTPDGKKNHYHIPSSAKQKLDTFLKELENSKDFESSNPSIAWEELAKDRIQKYKHAGLVLRGARHRENMSQVELAKQSSVHQNEISKIENGKRSVGKKVAQRLAKVLNFDYKLLTDLDN